MARRTFAALSSEHGQGLVSVNLAVFFFGLAAILGKLTGLPAFEITFGRVLIAGLALVGLGLVRKGGLEPVWGIALGVVLLGERPSPRAVVGGAIILGALALPTLARLRDRRAPVDPARRAGLGGSRPRP